MKFFEKLTIKNKLIVIIIFITAFTLLLGFITIGIIDIINFRNDMARNMVMIARVIGENSASALIFEDRISAQETLSSLETIPNIEYANLYTNEGILFASYNRIDSDETRPILNEGEPEYKNGKLYILYPIIFQNERYGVILIRGSTSLLYTKVFEYIITVIILLVVLVIVSLLITVIIQRIITRPILTLADMAKRISDENDYSIRVEKEGEDEIGILCDGFNNMLSQIEFREQERTKAEEALKKSEVRFRTIIEQTNDPLCVIQTDMFVFVNPTFEKYFGYSYREIAIENFDFLSLVAPQDKNRMLEVIKGIRSILKGNKTFEFIGISKLGAIYNFEANITSFEWDNKPAILATLRDITDRKRFEESLKYRANIEMLIAELSTNFINLGSEEFEVGINYALKSLGELFQVDRSYMYIFSEDLSFMYYVHEWCRRGIELKLDNFLIIPASNFPWMIEELKSFETIYVPRVLDFDPKKEEEKEALTARNVKSFLCVPIVYSSKLIGYIAFDSVFFEKNWSEEDIRIVKMAGEIIAMAIERNKSSEILAEEKERLSVTIRSLAEGVIAVNIDGDVILMNKAAEDLTGWSQENTLNQPLDRFFKIQNEEGARLENPINSVFKNKEAVEFTNPAVLLKKNKNTIVISYNCSPIFDRKSKLIGVVLTFNDISDKIKMEEEMLKASKIESLGIFAGGIAHDFNNILTAILGNINLAKLNHEPDSENYNFLSEAENATSRAKDLTMQLLTFAKGGAPVKKISSITEILIDTSNFVLSGSKIKCDYMVPDELWPVEIDGGQISQVVNNLVINAMQAMPDGGSIEISAKNIAISENYFLQLNKGNYIKITIKDSGTGISKENLQNIFDPFFTTKTDGNGLGLASTFSIIKKHDGAIDVESELGKGTSFYIYLPASIDEEIVLIKNDSQIVAGKGNILVMDDENVILKIAEKFLTKLGYEVDIANNGNEVITLYKNALSNNTPYDALIMDLTIPGGMGGKECVKKLLEIDPNVKAIVSSGYSNDPVMSNYKEYGFKGVVIKPYRIQELSQTIKQILD